MTCANCVVLRLGPSRRFSPVCSPNVAPGYVPCAARPRRRPSASGAGRSAQGRGRAGLLVNPAVDRPRAHAQRGGQLLTAEQPVLVHRGAFWPDRLGVAVEPSVKLGPLGDLGLVGDGPGGGGAGGPGAERQPGFLVLATPDPHMVQREARNRQLAASGAAQRQRNPSTAALAGSHCIMFA
jgi:hypothetical protein